MAVLSRAADLAGGNKKRDIFSDFKRNLNPTEYGGQLVKISNDESIKESLKNIVLTIQGERLFQPAIGSDINFLLFDNYVSYDPFDSGLTEKRQNSQLNNDKIPTPNDNGLIETLIKNAVAVSEPRVIIDSIVFYDYSENNALQFTIKFQTINNSNIQTLDVLLKRVR